MNSILVTLGIITLSIAYSNGNHAKIDKVQDPIELRNDSRLESNEPTKTHCCEVNCNEAGSCKATEASCLCTCAFGYPSCGEANTSEIYCNSAQLASQRDLVEYVRVDLRNENIACALDEIATLFSSNQVDRQYVITSRIDIQKYYENLQVYVEFYRAQSSDVQRHIDAIW